MTRMMSVRIAWLVVGLALGGVLLGARHAASETAECRAQLQKQDEQCQALAEKRAAACPGGDAATQSTECKQLSSEIAATCTRKPCAPPPRKRKIRGMGRGMSAPKKAAPPAKTQ